MSICGVLVLNFIEMSIFMFGNRGENTDQGHHKYRSGSS